MLLYLYIAKTLSFTRQIQVVLFLEYNFLNYYLALLNNNE